MPNSYAVVDLFAGPGGLGEGFTSFQDVTGHRPYSISFSVEKDPSAHSTLKLRSLYRAFNGSPPQEYFDFISGDIPEPNWQSRYPAEWQHAEKEALLLELGTDNTRHVLDKKLQQVLEAHGGNTVVIGGPPCQAYSLVGRSRNKGIKGYIAREDARHFLYREYIHILEKLRPAAFVMENVKGILSSKIEGEPVFSKVLDDLRNVDRENGGYHLLPISRAAAPALFKHNIDRPPDFVVKAEDFGVPQARHRVIIVGLRSDVAERLKLSGETPLLAPSKMKAATVADMLAAMPAMRSGLSRYDSNQAWFMALEDAVERLEVIASDDAEASLKTVANRANEILEVMNANQTSLGRAAYGESAVRSSCPPELTDWIVDSRVQRLPNNDTRGHMVSDLARYLFASIYAETYGVSPKAQSFPSGLAPSHKNWLSGHFSDRFRVQLWNGPSTTITSHISKDGHYFIHPDPTQCRSLTVREAARLQTFPDNYFFKGNRTQQYVQVGNAVPPFLARQIAEAVYTALETSSS